jgi:cell division protein FtsB
LDKEQNNSGSSSSAISIQKELDEKKKDYEKLSKELEIVKKQVYTDNQQSTNYPSN